MTEQHSRQSQVREMAAYFPSREISPLNEPAASAAGDTQESIKQLAEKVVIANRGVSVFHKRHLDAVELMTHTYELFLRVSTSEEEWHELKSMDVFKNRTRMLSDNKRALAVMQFATNANDEKSRKICSREANVILYAQHLGVSVEGFAKWSENITTTQAIDAMIGARNRLDCKPEKEKKVKRKKIVIPCDIRRESFPHFDQACAKDLPEEIAVHIIPILTEAFDKIEKYLQVHASQKSANVGDVS